MARHARALRRAALALLLGLAAAAPAPAVAVAASARGAPVAPADARATRSIYTLEYTHRTQSDLRGLFGAARDVDGAGLVHDIESRLDGELEQVAMAEAGQRRVLWRLRGLRARLRINGVESAENADAIAARLQVAPVLAELDDAGLVAGLRVPADMDAPTRAYVRALFAALQFAIPPARALRWDTREDDPSGRYLARYARASDGIVRTRLSYEPEQPVLAGETRVVQAFEPGGSTRARFAADGGLASLDGEETQRVRVGKTLIATGATTIRLRRTGFAVSLARAERAALDAQVAGLRAQPAERLSASAASASGALALHRRELGADTLASLLARLRAFRPAAPGSQEATSLYLKFKALVALQPDASAALAAELASAPADSETMLILPQALASSGHASAEAALVSVLQRRRDDWPAVAALVPVLGSLATPGEATITLLQALASASPQPPIASTATLALGTAAKHLLATAPDRGARVVDWLLARLDGTASATVRREALLALGNSAHPDVLAAATRHAGDPETGVRAAAMRALRWIDAPGARALLRERLAGDAESEVRLAAAQALGAQRMDADGFAAQRRAFTRETVDGVRIALLETLWAAAAEYPKARSIVEAARRDRSEAVRKAAVRLAGAP